MSFITIEEAETILGADFAPDGDKARLILLSNTWMKKQVGQIPDPMPEELKIAACEIIKGIQARVLYSGQERQTTREMVDANGVKVDETYADGSVAISSYEQIALDLIAASSISMQGFSFGVYRG